MEPVAVVTALALIEYFVFTALVGRARARAGLKAPATTGDPQFERYYRVQHNTLEQLAIFIPSLWMFGYYVDARIGAALGLVFIVGRVIYLRGYVADPAARGPGFVVGAIASMALLIGALGGAGVAWLS